MFKKIFRKNAIVRPKVSPIKKIEKHLEISQEIKQALKESKILSPGKKTIEESLKIKRIKNKLYEELNNKHKLSYPNSTLDRAVISNIMEIKPNILKKISNPILKKDISNILPEIYLMHLNKSENVSINRILLETSQVIIKKYN